MLVQETEGKFIHTYSDAGFTILQTSTGIEYSDAMDLKDYPQEYTETDHKIETPEDEVSTEDGDTEDTKADTTQKGGD